MSQAEVNVIPENIRANLAKCTNHTNLTCLECGYTGLIGIIRTESKWHYWAFIPLAVISLYGLAAAIYAMQNPFVMLHGQISSTKEMVPSFWAFLGCGLIGAIFGNKKRDFYLCPNCEKEIEKR